MGKLYDLTVKTGEYTDSQGQTKGRYESVGAVMQGKDGGMFIMLKKTFNPAGVPGDPSKDSVLISCFEPRQQGQQPQQQYQQPQQAPQQRPVQNNVQQPVQNQQMGGGVYDPNQDIPF